MKEDQKVYGELSVEISGDKMDKLLSEENIREIKIEITSDSGVTYRFKAIGHQLNWEIA